MKKKWKKLTVSIALSTTLVTSQAQPVSYSQVVAAESGIQYTFSGNDRETAGYAQGTISMTAAESGMYYFYWADDQKALDGFKSICAKKLNAGQETTVYEFGYHNAIPKGATKIIAVKEGKTATVLDAACVYEIPETKQLQYGAGKLLYTFNSYSDIHIDKESSPYYSNCEKNWAAALAYADKMEADFIISSGDSVTNASGFEKEWEAYEKILANSSYCNPIYEANGNHDMRNETKGTMDYQSGSKYKGNTAFVQASGANHTAAVIEKNKPYYYVIEENTGDLFIFMALENGSSPNQADNFSDTQINWVKDLLDTYYGTGINIYLIQHATIRGYSSGDIWKIPDSKGYIDAYYGGHMYVNGMKDKDGNTVTNMKNNTVFKNILEQYKGLIWMNGHTHMDLTEEGANNYTNQNGTSCNMVHNPSVAATTYVLNGGLEYDSNGTAKDGKGKDSQGYYVEAYENHVVYYGATLNSQEIFPSCCYIMEGSRNSEGVETSETRNIIYPEFEELVSNKEMVKEGATLQEALAVAKNMLDSYIKFASYNQYQAVKKLYRNNKNNGVLADATVVVEQIKTATEQLYAIGERLGFSYTLIDLYPKQNSYYFENTKDWSNVYCYAWNSDQSGDKNAAWPGVAISKTGSKKNGHDVYQITFPENYTYDKIIFNDGKTPGAKQTENIVLIEYKENCFSISGSNSEGKYTVNNYGFTE